MLLSGVESTVKRAAQVKPWTTGAQRGGSKLFSAQFAAPWGADCDEVTALAYWKLEHTHHQHQLS